AVRHRLPGGHARHRRLAEGDRQGEGALHREAHRRDGLRQLRAARPAGDVPAERRREVLDRGPPADEGRRQGEARLPLRNGLRPPRTPTADQAGRHAGIRRRAARNREVIRVTAVAAALIAAATAYAAELPLPSGAADALRTL